MTQRPAIPETLEGEGIRLRAFVPEHAQSLLEAVHESVNEVAPYETWCHADFTIKDAASYVQQWIDARSRGKAFYFAVETDQGEFLGACGLSGIEREHGVAGLGFWVRTSATGNGVATRAAARVARFGFEELNLGRIEMLAAEQNLASRRVAEKLGAALEGVLRRRLTLPDGPTDCALYALLSDKTPTRS
jgi:ribosomal-protein-serine acetyltransferase